MNRLENNSDQCCREQFKVAPQGSYRAGALSKLPQPGGCDGRDGRYGCDGCGGGMGQSPCPRGLTFTEYGSVCHLRGDALVDRSSALTSLLVTDNETVSVFLTSGGNTGLENLWATAKQRRFTAANVLKNETIQNKNDQEQDGKKNPTKSDISGAFPRYII